MNRIWLLILSLFFGINAFSNTDNSKYFLSYPQLSPDGKSIYFTYDDDLWSYKPHTGQTSRLTNLSGAVSFVKISPDGQKIAFSADQYGQNDVFILQLNTGEIKQLTYHDAQDNVSGWSWDSERIYFSSNRYNHSSTYSISYKGGTSQRLFNNYFNITNQLTEHPNGGYLYTMGMESTGQLARKRYKGPNNPEIYYYQPTKGIIDNLSDYEGKDLYPSVDKNGVVYYQSDENGGINNLFVYENNQKKALTNFDTDIQMPAVNVEGNKVVFIKDYQLYIYDVAKKTSTVLRPNLNAYVGLHKLESYNVKDNISYFDVSPDASKLAFVSRGILFVSDIEGKSIKKAWHTNERVMEVKWLADNKRVIFNQTVNGYPQWFVLNVHQDNAMPKQLTHEKSSQQAISLNKDRSQAVYISGRDELKIMNLSTLTSKTIVKDEFWAFQQSTPQFSPNNQYVTYTARRNFEEDVFTYELKTGKTINLTKTGVTETDPIWSPDGKHVYYTSNRTSPAYPYGLKESHIYQMAIDWFAKPFKSDHLDEIFSEPQEELDIIDKKKRRRKKDKEKRATAAKVTYKINPEGLRDRIELVSSAFGTQSNPFVTHLKSNQYIWYNSNQEGGRTKWFVTKLEDYRKKEEKTIHERPVVQVLEVQDDLYILSRNEIYKVKQEGYKKDKIELNFSFYKNLQEEFIQMFEETWAGVEENFYLHDFHGVDWQAKKTHYQQFLPYVKNRTDLRVLLNDMLGELNASHLGFRSVGKEEKSRLNFITNETGILFDQDNQWKIASIVRKSPASLRESNLKVGDVITHINGIEVNNAMHRDSMFSFPSLQKEIRFTVQRGDKKHTSKVHPIRTAPFKNLLYDEWINHNDHYVQENSNEQIAYAYMKDMTENSLEQFYLDLVAKDQNSKGLILDLRFNTGGNVHDKVLQFLAQRPYLEWQYRNGAKAPQSTFAPSGKPIVLLINEGSLSDAEMTAAGFKALKLGTIIGNGTYRWIIFTSGKGLVDGSMFRIPAWGCYTLDGDNLEHTGVEPDIHVDVNLMQRERSEDPQLDIAIEHIKHQW